MLVFCVCMYVCVRAWLHHSPSGSISHAELRGNVESSGQRHPAVTDPTTGVWEPVRSH